jgi:DNA-binding CsgD family transcriptional regulator
VGKHHVGLRVDAIERLTRDATDSRSLRAELLTMLRREVGFDWYVWVLTDPATSVGVDPLAEIPDRSAIATTIRLKYVTPLNRWTSLDHAARIGSLATESRLWREAQTQYGVVDVASLALRDRYGCWGFIDLWSTSPFTDDDLSVLDSLAPSLTGAMRLTRALSFRAPTAVATPSSGPVVLVLGDDLAIREQARSSEEWLRLILPQPDGSQPIPACAFNVAAQLLAREAGIDDNEAKARMPLPGGHWVTLRASRLDPHNTIAVTIERTTPHDRLDVFGRAHGLSDREAQLVALLGSGVDTTTAAARLHLSPHTVQDHLKAMFAKSGVHSRRELLARALGAPVA